MAGLKEVLITWGPSLLGSCYVCNTFSRYQKALQWTGKMPVPEVWLEPYPLACPGIFSFPNSKVSVKWAVKRCTGLNVGFFAKRSRALDSGLVFSASAMSSNSLVNLSWPWLPLRHHLSRGKKQRLDQDPETGGYTFVSSVPGSHREVG